MSNEKEFAWILEEAEKKFEEGMHWVDYSNMFFGQNSKYMPASEEERKKYLKSDVFKKVMDMKFELEEMQETNENEVEEYKGNFMVRGPKSLHKDLVEIAEKEGVSLNQLATFFLAQSVARYNNR